MEKYFSFSGRIRRLHYVLRAILTNVVVYISAIAYVAAESASAVPLIFLFLVAIISTWFSLAAAVQRCHDMDKSGWYCLIPIYGPIIMFFVVGTKGWNQYGDDPKQAAPIVTHKSPVLQPVPTVDPHDRKTPVTGYTGGYTDVINRQVAEYQDINLTDDYYGAGSHQTQVNTQQQQQPVPQSQVARVSQPATSGDSNKPAAGKYKKGTLYD